MSLKDTCGSHCQKQRLKLRSLVLKAARSTENAPALPEKTLLIHTVEENFLCWTVLQKKAEREGRKADSSGVG